MQINVYSSAVADVYEHWYPSRDPAEIAFWGHFASQQGETALEIACGSGQIMIPLLQQGLAIHGLDASGPMLEKARLHAHQRGIELTLYKASMHDFTLPHRYHLIYAPFGALHHLEDPCDAKLCLQQCREHLHPDGSVLLHFLQPPTQPIQTDWRKTNSSFRAQDAAIIDTYGQSHYDPQTMLMVSQCRIVTTRAGRKPIESDWTDRLRLYHQQDITMMLEQSGFEVVQIHTGYALPGLPPQTMPHAPMWIFEAIKK